MNLPPYTVVRDSGYKSDKLWHAVPMLAAETLCGKLPEHWVNRSEASRDNYRVTCPTCLTTIGNAA